MRDIRSIFANSQRHNHIVSELTMDVKAHKLATLLPIVSVEWLSY